VKVNEVAFSQFKAKIKFSVINFQDTFQDAMLLKGHKNLIAANATTKRRAAISACWQFGVVVTLGSSPNTPSNNSIDSMMLRDKTRRAGSPERLVGGYLFSHQR